MVRRICYLALGLTIGLSLALMVGIGMTGNVTAALPGVGPEAAQAPVVCSTPGPWTVVNPISTAVFGAMVASDGTYAYAAGGYSYQLPGATNQFARYNPVTNTWTALAQLPASIYDGAAAYAPSNNKIYIFGGTDGAVVVATTRIYDIATNTWSTGAPLPAPRQQMGVGYANGTIYIAAGSDNQSLSPQSTLFAYNVAGDSWTTLASLPQPLAGPGSGVVNGHLYIAGGRDNSSPNRTTVYDYNISTNTWTTVAPLLSGVNVPGSAVLGGELVVFGGGFPFSDPGYPSAAPGQVPFTTNVTQIYDPTTNAWTTGPSLNTARSFVGGAAVGNYLVAVGGFDGTTSLSSVEVSLVPCGSPTATPTSTITPTATNTPTPTPPSGILNGHLTWQGISQPNSHNVGLTATITICVGGVSENFLATTDASGNFTITTGIANGTYNWHIKGNRWLANDGTLTFSGGTSTQDFGTQRAGDCNDNNLVNSQDFAILRAAFGGSSDLRADFNNDGVVSSPDFTLQRSNFGAAGASTNCP